MAAFWGYDYEKRPLKRPRLGPADVYPQDLKQKEDELTAVSVKQGFNNTPQILDEYGSAKSSNITAAKFGAFFSAIIAKKHELNTFQDTGKKKQQINPKENFWPVTARSKNAIEAWFKDLAGSKPLTSLGKKVPIFNKKEEIFTTLYEYTVPMMRAIWFIKMTSAYYVAISEAKIKKRQLTDPSQDWTQALTKFLREQLQKLTDYYHSQTTFVSNNTLALNNSTTSANMTHDVEVALEQWQYCVRLARYMYEEGLLDRHDVLTWILELIEKPKATADDGILKLLLPLVLQYVDEFVQSELLSRRLAHFCAKKIAQLCNESSSGSPRAQSPLVTAGPNGNTNNSNPAMNPILAIFMEYNNCPHHRTVILALSATLQAITLNCPTALVWNCIGEGKSNSVFNGSPLDLLPCAPSNLPMHPGPNNQMLRVKIRQVEQQIKQRGRAAEVRWSCEKWQQSTVGTTIGRILSALEALDRHCFEKSDSANSLDILYNKIFPPNSNKDSDLPCNDEPVVLLLCEWAVCIQRTGEYRSMVVAALLEKKQAELTAEKYADEIIDEKDSVSSASMIPSGLPIFQNLLMKFLDEDAPILDDNPSSENKQAFANLLLLFAELIRHDVFSHDAYMCTLISRGCLTQTPLRPTTPAPEPTDSKIESVKQEVQEWITSSLTTASISDVDHQEIGMDLDDQKLDDEFNKLLQCIKEESQASIDQHTDSVKSEKSDAAPASIQLPESQPTNKPSRELLYTLHFPLPVDDSSNHDCNQRHILLYGVGKARDEARHTIKKITKEILKMFSKKSSLDSVEGGKIKKHSKGDIVINFDSIFQKFQTLSYFDQHVVTSTCALTVVEQLNSFATGNSNYLPLVENISFLFDLMEYCLNITGLLECVIQLLKELSQVEAQLILKQSSLVGSYTTLLCLYIVAILRRYHACLLVSQEQTAAAFEGLCSVVKHVNNPSDCTSSERCILAYLYDAYISCSYLKAKYSEFFGSASSKVKQTLYANIQPSASNLLWNTTFMIEFINNPKLKLETQLLKQLNDSHPSRYSLVVNAIIHVCNGPDPDRLNDLSILCAELTACCNALSCEWLGVLKALCCSSNHSCGFIDVLTQVDVADLSFHDSLAVFTAILIARHCFSLQDFVVHVALPSLLAACPSAGGDQDAEPGARLTCHLLLRLFKTAESPSTSPTNIKNTYNIKLSCDRHLLSAAHNSITVGAVLAVLKAILVLGDAYVGESKSKAGSSQKQSGEISISEILCSMDDIDPEFMAIGPPARPPGSGMESAGLSEFAKHALSQICSQEWVRERCLQDPEELCTQDLLLDPMLSNKQAQQLLHMICYSNGQPPNIYNIECTDEKQTITRILQNLDQWTLRVSWLELQLMFKQCSAENSQERNQLLDNVARSTVEIFQQQTEDKSLNNSGTKNTSSKSDADKSNSIWLVAPMIAKLPSAVQGQVLKSAGQVLESGNWSAKGKDKDRNVQRSTSLLSHQPFLSLVLTCLKGQDEQRECLLTSLNNQLSQVLHLSKDEKFHAPDDPKMKQALQDSLQLRLSLVGGMFDTIQRSNTTTTDWAILFLQLICNGVVDTQTNSELFTTVLDMLTVLIHSTVVLDSSSSDKAEDKKMYTNLIKKLKKELGDKHSEGIVIVRQLLPLSKQQCDVITCEPMGSLIDTKGNKIAGFDSIDKKQGLQVSSKLKVNPWDLLEGHKNPAPLSWAWFGAVHLERKPLKYEEQHRLLVYHTHSLKKPITYFLEPPPLPPEDLEPPPSEKVEEKPLREQNIEVSQRTETKKTKPIRRRRQSRLGNNTPTYMPQQGPMQQILTYQQIPPYQPPQHSWYNQQHMQQPTCYSQQPLPPGGPRFDRSLSSSKALLNNILRARQPGSSQFVPQQRENPQQAIQNMQMLQKRQIIHQLRAQHAPGIAGHISDNQSMYAPHLPPQQPPPTAPLHHLPQGVSQTYGGYGNTQINQNQSLVEPTSSNMMFDQSYQPPLHNMMGMRGQQENYMSQHQSTQQRSMQTSNRLQHQITQSNIPNSAIGLNQVPGQQQPQPQMTPPGYSAMQQIAGSHAQQQQQRLQQYRHQQQLMAMQQKPTQQQQQTAALVAQLQRQLSGGGQPPPQHHSFTQPPY